LCFLEEFYGLWSLGEDFAVLKRVEIVSDSEYKIGELFREKTQTKVKDLCGRFPMR
jgi:hypothetical protein